MREGSGGKGLHKGGNGVIRDIEFLEAIQCSILSERRANSPYGMAGGSPAQRGKNLWIKRFREEDGDLPLSFKAKTNDPSINKWGDVEYEREGTRTINLGGKQTVKMGKGDRIIVCTPGGGGWGAEDEGKEKNIRKVAKGHGKGDPKGSWSDRLAAQEGV